jgi:hypothetical protein
VIRGDEMLMGFMGGWGGKEEGGRDGKVSE